MYNKNPAETLINSEQPGSFTFCSTNDNMLYK